MGEKEPDELKVVHTELDAVWKKLCHKLDALSNFHFTPKPVIDEMTVHANVAAIKMVTTTYAPTLRPLVHAADRTTVGADGWWCLRRRAI
jgi:U3 small nucleolar ribonucleoprotein component